MKSLSDCTCETIEHNLAELDDRIAAMSSELDDICAALPASREVSIARTNIETGLLWLGKALAGFQ